MYSPAGLQSLVILESFNPCVMEFICSCVSFCSVGLVFEFPDWVEALVSAKARLGNVRDTHTATCKFQYRVVPQRKMEIRL